jgi:hypothetical protein
VDRLVAAYCGFMLVQPSRVLISRLHGLRIHQPIESTVQTQGPLVRGDLQEVELNRERSRNSRHAACR